MSETPSLTLATGDGGRLSVEYRRVGELFRHRVCLTGPGGEPLAEWDAVLTGANEDWPASPPIQELSRESTAAGRDCLLGVGSAGRCHWSVSVEPWSGGEAGQGGSGLLFDVACRCPESPGWLGSSYTIDSAQRLTILPLGDAEESHCGLHLLRIGPRTRPDAYPATIRWRYVIAAVE